MNYKVCIGHKVKTIKKGKGILVLESDDYTAKEIKDIKAKGYKVLGYLSIGTLEKYRPWYKDLKHLRKKQLPDWPDEYYVDYTRKEWQTFLQDRAKAIMAKGFSGLWLDNLDVYEELKLKSGLVACFSMLKKLKDIGKYTMVNGGSLFWERCLEKGIRLKTIVTAVTQEEVFSRITNYEGTGKFGKQYAGQSNYYRKLLIDLHKRGVQTFPFEYTRSVSLKETVKAWCKETGMTGYYIAEDVRL